MKLLTWINGRLVDTGDDRLSVFDNALLYGDGLFETLLAVDGNVLYLKEHLRRLYRGAGLIDLAIPADGTKLERWLKRAAHDHRARLNKIRLTITSGRAARWVGRQGKPQIIISTAPHRLPTKPFELHLARFRVDQDSKLRQVKTLSCALHATALRQARKAGCDDALLLNQNDLVAEVTTANVFLVKNNRVFTPPLSAGCLGGVTRSLVLRELRKLGIAAGERNISLPELTEADELFISSSLKLVVGVSRIKAGRRRYRFPAGPLTQQLTDHFHRLAGLV